MVEGVDFSQTFAPVSQIVTVRIVLVLSVNLRLTAHHLDVTCAFMNSTLDEEVYIRLPRGFNINGKRYGKCIKSIYGLKQAAHDWYELQLAFLLTHDTRMRQSSMDPCLYFITDSESGLTVFIAVSVDDYVVASSSDAWYRDFVEAFSSIFEVNDLGVVSHLLQNCHRQTRIAAV